ncbi:MAG: hypothetical protein L0Y78_01095 [candidate division NC10 bacterium]|nr:hypothetical protein [candidate division NC10 bacterium]
MTRALIVLAASGILVLLAAGVAGFLALYGALPLHVHIALAMLGAILSIAANAGVIIHLISGKE